MVNDFQFTVVIFDALFFFIFSREGALMGESFPT